MKTVDPRCLKLVGREIESEDGQPFKRLSGHLAFVLVQNKTPVKDRRDLAGHRRLVRDNIWLEPRRGHPRPFAGQSSKICMYAAIF